MEKQGKQKVVRTEEEWRAQLTPDQFAVARQAATEQPFSGEHCDTKDPGLYRCICCDAELFGSGSKFDSHSGWPSYFEPISKDAVTEHQDVSHGMVRTEVVCARCDAHLGHLFPDGPDPTGLRYCINSLALRHEPESEG